MEKIEFFYELIGNLKHVSSFEMIFKLISKRLNTSFNVTRLAFFNYSEIKKRFFLGDEMNFKLNTREFYIAESAILSKISSEFLKIDLDKLENNTEGTDKFLEELYNVKKHNITLYPLIVKDKMAGFFVIEAEKILDKDFIDTILDIVAISFQRSLLSGHIMGFEEKKEHFEENYIKEILQNKILEVIQNNSSLGYGVLSINFYDLSKRNKKIDLRIEVYERIYQELIKEAKHNDVLLKYGSNKVIIISPGRNYYEISQMMLFLKEKIENHKYDSENAISGAIKVSYGYSSYPEKAETLNDIIFMAENMLEENKKIEGWLKSI